MATILHRKYLCSARVDVVASVEDWLAVEPGTMAAVLAQVGTPCAVLSTSYSLLPSIQRLTQADGESALEEIKRVLAAKGLRLGQALTTPEPPARDDSKPQTPFGNFPKEPIEVVDPETRKGFTAPAWRAWEMSAPVAGYDLYIPGRVVEFCHLEGKQVELFNLATFQR